MTIHLPKYFWTKEKIFYTTKATTISKKIGIGRENMHLTLPHIHYASHHNIFLLLAVNL